MIKKCITVVELNFKAATQGARHDPPFILPTLPREWQAESAAVLPFISILPLIELL